MFQISHHNCGCTRCKLSLIERLRYTLMQLNQLPTPTKQRDLLKFENSKHFKRETLTIIHIRVHRRDPQVVPKDLDLLVALPLLELFVALRALFAHLGSSTFHFFLPTNFLQLDFFARMTISVTVEWQRKTGAVLAATGRFL